MYVENLEMDNSLKWALFIKVSGQITSYMLYTLMEHALSTNDTTCYIRTLL